MTREKEIINDLNDLIDYIYKVGNKETVAEKYDKIIDYINTLEPYYYSLLSEGLRQNLTVVFEKEISRMLKKEATSISRMRIFINHTYEDDIYQLDGYGNLANITTEDLDTQLLDLIKIVEED